MRHLVFASALIFVCALSAVALDKQNVVYAAPDGVPLYLDLHVPDGPGPFPAAILVHGGGFDGGSKTTNVRPLFAPLSEAGFAWFSIDYRLAPQAHFTQAIDDVFTAIKWVKANSAAYHVNPNRIALIGESAGGFLVNYAGTHLTSATQVAAVVDFYGPSDYGTLAVLRREHPEQFDMANINGHAAHGGGIHFFGFDQLDADTIAKLHAMSPLAGVHKGMPPFLCIHGNADDQVAFSQTPPFCQAIKAAGSDCRIITIEGGGHGMSRWQKPEMQHWKSEMVAWLQSTMSFLNAPERRP
jgi:alpha-L-fucosidase 2